MKEAERIDPWGSGDIKDYQNLFKEFGIESLEKYKKKYSDNRYMRRGIIFGHRDFGVISEAIEKKKPFVMMTGLMPSGRFHFGHKMVADQIVWYQNKGAEVFVCVADLEACLMRGIDQKTAITLAKEEYLTNYVALGLKPEKLHFYFQSNYVLPYYRFRDMHISNRVTLNELKSIYGDLSSQKILSVLTQVADILHPQLPEFGGPKPTIVPVGADQDPHMRLTRDIASRQRGLNLIPPSSTCHKFMHGLRGGKMSSSDPKSHIALTDEPEIAEKKIKGSKTGGRATAREQKERGGVPEDCMIYELFLYHLMDDDRDLEEIYRSCRSGERSCGECKKTCAETMTDFLKKHQKRRVNAEKIVEKILGRK
ncbi:MAG: tryptophan--tRNA ligase [Candidatus Altiarchaeota archaeon]|nr:tryptophan--tRNA ligase [Candidatus Altiarchaeota archaeon]